MVSPSFATISEYFGIWRGVNLSLPDLKGQMEASFPSLET